MMLLGMLIPMTAANCSDKKAVKSEDTETTDKTEGVIKVSVPPFQKFVVVTVEEEVLSKSTDPDSPNLLRWIESDCESDFCEEYYQWSDQPGKPGFELSTDIMACEGRIFPVLGEEGDYYKVSTVNKWCDIESAFIAKKSVADIECQPVKADMLEADDYMKSRVVKDGKYKGIVLSEEYDEMDGDILHVGMLIDGVVATPLVYDIDCSLTIDQKEDIVINEEESCFFLKFNKSLAMTAGEGGIDWRLDLNKLTDEQIAKIVDTVTTKKPEFVSFMYQFPAMGTQYFYYIVR